MVAVFKDHVGRGPTRARAYIEDDVITVVLEDTMIQAEKTLADEGEDGLVHGLRRVFQDKFREEAIAIVERMTGRTVRAFLSDHAVEPDIAAEVFVLGEHSEQAEPAPGPN
jgi:uncharacterized protein YbcI